jgi:elongation factor Ts
MEITPAMVRTLREKTGLPMMECKKALEETKGDEKAALESLRKKGRAQVDKRAERVTAEGRVACYVDPATGRAAVVELLCETAPVTRTDDFIRLSKEVAQAAAGLDNPTAEQILEQRMASDPTKKVVDLLHEAVNKIRENIKIGRIGTLKGSVGCYVHHDARKAVLVEFSGPLPGEVASDVCMHVAAMRPPFTRREEVDQSMVAQKTAVAREEVQNKPPQIVEKIVSGKLDRWYGEIVLLEQPFVKDDKLTVAQHLRQHGPTLTVNRFVRLEIGEA